MTTIASHSFNTAFGRTPVSFGARSVSGNYATPTFGGTGDSVHFGGQQPRFGLSWLKRVGAIAAIAGAAACGPVTPGSTPQPLPNPGQVTAPANPGVTEPRPTPNVAVTAAALEAGFTITTDSNLLDQLVDQLAQKLEVGSEGAVTAEQWKQNSNGAIQGVVLDGVLAWGTENPAEFDQLLAKLSKADITRLLDRAEDRLDCRIGIHHDVAEAGGLLDLFRALNYHLDPESNAFQVRNAPSVSPDTIAALESSLNT